MLCAILSQRLLAEPAHPCLYCVPADREAIVAKIAHETWAAQAYAKLKSRVDQLVARCQSDPAWLASRLLLNWQTHYRTPIVRKDRWVAGAGQADIPTVRFAGARDWATKFHAPDTIDDFKPQNDSNGKVWLINGDTGRGEWTDPGTTGRAIELANDRILQAAADASFVYWISGDEKYARFASDVLWAYLHALSQTQMPQDESGKLPNKIIGLTSFEVIHEQSMPPLGQAYDFLHDYLAVHHFDLNLIQAQLKRLADRVIDAGNATGNWNLNQANLIAPASLALDDDSDFADHHGRQYYADVLLNARLPNQTGILHVIEEGYDPATALWPEAPGYGFGTTPQIIQIASMLGSDPAGEKLLDNALLPKAILAQSQLLYPSGWSIGLGDTDNTRINTQALELLIAAARKNGHVEFEQRLTAILQNEIDSGRYDRAAQSTIPALIQFVPHLLSTATTAAPVSRMYLGVPLNVAMQRNGTDPATALAAAMYGTQGGHVHANGLAIELYGAGLIMGADPGRGASYWTADHVEYYEQPPAHNTVIVNGRSDYAIYGHSQNGMKTDFAEPAFGGDGVSPDISVVQASFDYTTPPARQQRTLALIRLSESEGFYFDIFRSRATNPEGAFQDYLYHNIGQSLEIRDGQEHPLALAATSQLASKELLKGYDYFRNESSANFTGDLHAIFTVSVADQPDRFMHLWMPGNASRTVFSVSAPPDHAAREELPALFQKLPMPTVIVRQAGDAWGAPFVAAYQFSQGPASIRSVRSILAPGKQGDLVADDVHTAAGDTLIFQDDQAAQPHTLGEFHFTGSFAAVLHEGAGDREVYLAHGRLIADPQITLASNTSIDASLIHQSDGWRYSASGPLHLSIKGPANSSELAFDGDLPAGKNLLLPMTAGR
jgi:hypothetical protein